MLPPEIFDKVCSYLQFKDIASLCQVCPVSESAIKEAVLEKCPHFDIEYSQWDSWKSCALNFPTVDTEKFEEDLECPVFINQPLPDDFECLCKDVYLEGSLAYNDKGVLMEDIFLDLTESEVVSSPAPPIKPEVISESSHINLVNYDGRSLKVASNVLRQKCTSSTMAAVSRNEKLAFLTIKDISNKDIDCPQRTVKLPIKMSFRLQIIGEIVLFTHTEPNQKRACFIFYVRRRKVFPSPRYRLLERAPAGMLFYDGHIYDVIIPSHTRRIPVVQSNQSYDALPRSSRMNRYHNVEQDDKYRQYGLVFNSVGLLSALVDLKSHKLKDLTGPYRYEGLFYSEDDDYTEEGYFRMAGISKGSIGVWKYSKGFLSEMFKKQHSCELPKQVGSLFYAEAPAEGGKSFGKNGEDLKSLLAGLLFAERSSY